MTPEKCNMLEMTLTWRPVPVPVPVPVRSKYRPSQAMPSTVIAKL